MRGGGDIHHFQHFPTWWFDNKNIIVDVNDMLPPFWPMYYLLVVVDMLLLILLLLVGMFVFNFTFQWEQVHGGNSSDGTIVL